jgi:hypothetical protein
MGPTQPPIQWALQLSHRTQGGQAVKLNTHLHLEPRSSMVEPYLHVSLDHYDVLN